MIFDIIVIAGLLLSAIIAFLRGFIREALTILGVVGGGIAALAAGPKLSPIVRGWFGVGEGAEEDVPKFFDLVPYTFVADALAYGAVFVVVLIALSILSHFISGWVKKIGLGALDRTFGVIFGIVRAVIFFALLYLPLYLFIEKETRDQWFEGSRSHVYIEGGAAFIAQYLPEGSTDEMRERAGEAADSMAESTREKLQEMEVLRRDDDAAPLTAPPPAGEVPAQEAPEPGYGEEQRQDMQNLILEEETDVQPQP